MADFKLSVYQMLASLGATFLISAGVRPEPSLPVKPKWNPESSSRPHHAKLWDSCKIRSDWKGEISKTIHRINVHKEKYKKASSATGVPWHVVAALHNMESTGSFKKHLHEGSSLRSRTRWVPKGRPKSGTPPFTWQESAYDALYTLKRMDRYNWSDIGETLYQCEKWNGLGYLKYRKVNSPFLWSGTNHYGTYPNIGKYVSDGRFDRTATSSQVGVVPILKFLNYFSD